MTQTESPSQKFAAAAAEIARGWMAKDPTLTAEKAIDGAIRWMTERMRTERPDLLLKVAADAGIVTVR